MTICIGALCEDRETLVCASDEKVGFGSFSADGMALKNMPFWDRGWTVMYSGNDVSHAKPVIDHAEDLLQQGWTKLKQKGKRRRPLEQRLVVDALDAAYGWRLEREQEHLVLKPAGFTFEEFRKHGRKNTTDDVYSDLSTRMRAVTLDRLEFLLAGFDAKGIGHIWSVDGSHAPRNYDSIGFGRLVAARVRRLIY